MFVPFIIFIGLFGCTPSFRSISVTESSISAAESEVTGNQEQIESASLFSTDFETNFNQGFSNLRKPLTPMGLHKFNYQSQIIPDGRVLRFGGSKTAVMKTVDVFDPELNEWSFSDFEMNTARQSFCSVVKNENMFAIGGLLENNNATDLVEVMNYQNLSWLTIAPTLVVPRHSHSCIALQDGRILVVGGRNENGAQSSAEIFDQSEWQLTGQLPYEVVGTELYLLPNGHVIAVGGFDSGYNAISKTMIFDPEDNSWSLGPEMNTARYGFSGLKLSTGHVMIMGGRNSEALDSVEILNTGTMSFESLASMNESRVAAGAVELANGKILIVGGYETDFYSNYFPEEIYNPESDEWEVNSLQNNPMRVHRPTVHRLNDNRILIYGGFGSSGMWDSHTYFQILSPTPIDVDLISEDFGYENSNATGEVGGCASQGYSSVSFTIQSATLDNIAVPTTVEYFSEPDQEWKIVTTVWNSDTYLTSIPENEAQFVSLFRVRYNNYFEEFEVSNMFEPCGPEDDPIDP